jgi:hypothetical protein
MNSVYIAVAIIPVLLFLIAWLLVTLHRLKKEQVFVANARQKLNANIETNRTFASLSPEDDDSLGIIPGHATFDRP